MKSCSLFLGSLQEAIKVSDLERQMDGAGDVVTPFLQSFSFTGSRAEQLKANIADFQPRHFAAFEGASDEQFGTEQFDVKPQRLFEVSRLHSDMMKSNGHRGS